MTIPSVRRIGPAPAATPAMLGVAAATLLFLDGLRVFLPSLITLVGQPGESSAAGIGAYALIWFILPAFVAFARPGLNRLATAVVCAWLLLPLRFLLQMTNGGMPQLAVSSLMVGLGACAFVGLVMSVLTPKGVRPREITVGLVAGIAASTIAHIAFGTVELVWRDGWLSWVLLITEVAVAAFLMRRARRAPAQPPVDAPPDRSWLAIGPALFLVGTWTANPAVAQTAIGRPLGPMVIGAAAVVGVWCAARPRLFTAHPLLPAFVLAAAATIAVISPEPLGGIHDVLPPWFVATQAIGHLAICALIGWAAAPGRTARAASRPGTTPLRGSGAFATGGLVLFVVLVFAFYAAYDVGYPNLYLPVVAALVVAVCVVGAGPPTPPARPPLILAMARTGIALCIVATLAAFHTGASPVERTDDDAAEPHLRLVTYNIRMGYGLDGRLRLSEQANALRQLNPDVVVLGEVDRGWLLNGGHDSVSRLADQLGMRVIWAPAADPLWGDAILTALPVSDVRSVPLPPSGPTGAQALSATVTRGGQEYRIIATHLQPDDYEQMSPTFRAQVLALRSLVDEAAAGGHPAVLAGDLNIDPEVMPDAWAIVSEGLRDALGEAAPFSTIPTGAGEPMRIDHIITSRSLEASDPAHPDLPWSDHLPVAITLRPKE
ncbi:endonuclease/exonuclease/phosphatase family protein [Janibacter sp. GXQ6167]|uniref:endonuclease/exonuclease/phosphatase family protein n=1 Tax=Janibacter sp. GXQ6167 TaxID=3240791 RepID=UPI003523C374